MQITEVRLKKLDGTGRMKAYASVTFDEQFVVHDMRVVEGQKGLFVAMPSRRLTNGDYRDIAHPITVETREMIQTTVLNIYQEAEDETALAN